METTLLVSVIIPFYNSDRYLAQAIESVVAQTYQPVEIIVIDDGSTDNSADVAKRFGEAVHYCYQTNSGTAAARNHGIELAQGNFLAFLDADDLWMPDKLERQMAAFASHPELDIVSGQVQQFHSPELDESIKAKIYCPPDLMPGHIPSAIVIKRESFFRVGLFETHWKLAEFPSWYVRATELGIQMMTLPNLVAKRRLHKTNKGVNQRQDKTEYIRILKASLDRRRAIGQLS
ncbi:MULTISPECIES: glycosyltransferase family A protein [unclassified Coleofasciculus]|uniref:glycosyltransferase family A protein n=1 Tax=unclassified Coleofasciculus TaxID=2692782 RepID=UPI00187E9DBB|nr:MULTISPECIES: glycosyltransferase family A protein [unclassified Coleofasciculus]MBE9125525.1 glycosyltransferase family 2 protein [Coleofasciculus sp. LEGE 07081]MBE9148611.1 glycosyltransferase family 2 protein [Coleofasciculus sp. LEGE 07092]